MTLVQKATAPIWDTTEWVLRTFIGWLTTPIWLVATVLRNKLLKTLIGSFLLISFIIISKAGMGTYLQGLQMVLQLLFAMGFMIIQFVALFWFLSKTKTIETRPGEKGLVTFNEDYFGSEHLVSTVTQWTDLLVDREQLISMGGETLSGILLEGEPGTGKTLLARCLASEAKAAFIGMAGSDFQAMFFGIGPMKIVQMGNKAKGLAKQFGACICFIDEIDAIGGARGGGGDPRAGPVRGGMAGGLFGGGGMGVLSRLLVLMDGITEIPLRDRIQNWLLARFGYDPIDPGVVLFMAATNRPDILDPALIRPGRFDKRITVDKPDKRSRTLIFEGYLRKVKHDPAIDVDELVSLTSDVTPALIESAVRKDGVRMAIFQDRDYITQRDIEDAIDERKFGLQNPITDFDPVQKQQVAYHEAGHAVIMHLEKEERLIRRVSIIRRSGGILGYVDEVTTTDVYAQRLEAAVRYVKVGLAGHIASELALGEPWSGAWSDFGMIQRLVRVLAIHGYFGTFPFDLEDPMKHKATAQAADEKLRQWAAEVRITLDNNWPAVEALAHELLDKEDLPGAEAIAIIEENINEVKTS